MRGQAHVQLLLLSSRCQQCLKMMTTSHELGDSCLKRVKYFAQHIGVFSKTIAQILSLKGERSHQNIFKINLTGTFFEMGMQMFFERQLN